MSSKYFRPKSWTWRIGVFVVICGILSFIDSIHPLGVVGDILRGAFGSTSPFMLIIIGSGTITMRGALPDIRSL